MKKSATKQSYVWKKSTFYYIHRHKSTLQTHYRHTTGTLQAHSGTHTQITKIDGFEFYKLKEAMTETSIHLE